MNRKTHRCSAAKDEHPIKVLVPAQNVHQQHNRYNGERCLCHGHCGACGEAVVMCRMGTFHHAKAYTDSFKVYR